MRLLFLQRFFHTWCPHVDFSRAPVFVSLRALELMSVQFLPFDVDVTSFARLVRYCLATAGAPTITAITST